MSDVTIAVATFNGERYLAQTVASALATGHRVVVSDDGSTDSTPDILAQFNSIAETILQPRNLGIGRNYQFLLDRCETPLIWLLNQDDLILPHNNRVEFPRSQVTVLNGWRIDENGKRQRLIYRRPPFHSSMRGVYKALTIENFAMSPSQVVFPAELARSAGGFLVEGDPGQGAEDWMCWLRLASAAVRFSVRLRPRMAYRFHPGNYSKHGDSHMASRLAVRHAFPPPPERDRRLQLRW